MPPQAAPAGGGNPWIGILLFIGLGFWLFMQFRGRRRERWEGRFETWAPIARHLRDDAVAVWWTILAVLHYRRDMRSARDTVDLEELYREH